MSECNNYKAEPNLEVLPLTKCNKGLVSFYVRSMEYDVRSNNTIRSIITFAIRRQQNDNAVNRNLTSVLNIWKNCSERF